jgi:thiamine-monophosphate kinase
MEAQFVQWLRERLPDHPNLRLGIGDDAAVLTTTDPGQTVVTTDLVSDGVDFRLGEVDPRRVGRKALAVNLSDLAAMAAKPQAVVVAIALPRGDSAAALELAIALYEGMLPLAEEFDVPIVGGDTNLHDGPLVVCGTAFGLVTGRGPLTRGGGQVGDRLLVTGKLGGSIAGHHLDFTPRIHEALLLHKRYNLHAGMDLSDGLALDASRLAAASGRGAVIDVDGLPISEAARELDDPLAHALGDGEDFELLLAVAPDVAKQLVAEQPVECGLTDVGELTAEPGLRQRDAQGKTTTLEPAGWLHGQHNV